MSSPTSPNSPNSQTSIYFNSPWQNKLKEHCRVYRMKAPVWGTMSDKRGGRTAWSSNVTIGAEIFSARYWYDGQYVNNAKEDAAEVALQWMQKLLNSSPYGHN
ncbi:uncharacterized protein LAJ45_05891 [Morchella importuna]|uniref:DRBM domain-containing protein n=1 Tax=Morchella conica CCBAS932 TaxID=1392247 RepID=A0A3N4KMZ1_9PEZI|nr:uncharacterized protein LAJ45_05891 [Morchella importuna]KAH8150205.1 hypothetical protein LAJ45_05891 [Morchella importuna]RPB11954.1 hypothetical protein P167DRAFT_574874 [Morchella conica CCBAS932]